MAEFFTRAFSASLAAFDSQKITPIGITADVSVGNEGRTIIFGC
jgi:hypothetical protein